MTQCEACCFYNYDEEYDEYICDVDLDEDEMVRFLSGRGTVPTGGPATNTAPPGVNRRKYGWIFPPLCDTMALPHTRRKGRVRKWISYATCWTSGPASPP
mgnify:FL=1